MNTYDLYWSPEGRKIATVEARSSKSAIRKAPLPYRRALGEIYAVQVLFDSYGWYIGEPFEPDCVRDCSASGSVDDAVEYWRKQLHFAVPRDRAIAYLREFGAWPMETDKYDQGLTNTDDDTLARRVLWLACCEISEEGEWLGLIH